MASASSFCSNPSFCTNGIASSSSRNRFVGFAFESSFFDSKFPRQQYLSLSSRINRPGPISLSTSSAISGSSHTFDVVIIGAGIIGLTIARQFLIGSDLSVAVVDKAVPCSGATGAGQGYLWMVHQTPGSDKWELTLRSRKLWEMLAESISDQGLNPQEELGWKKTGSLLVGRTTGDSVLLSRRVQQLSEAGLQAEYLSGHDLLKVEPALMVGEHSSAAFLPDDCQLDAHRTVAFIEKANRHFSSKGRYAEFYHEPVIRLLRSASCREFEAVQTSKTTLYSKKAIIVAAGCWSGSLMDELLRESEILLHVPVRPRKGHLLMLENSDVLQLNHGLMEVGYVDHQTILSNEPLDHEQSLSISMTATMDNVGNLVLGSSRQFAGFSSEVDERIITGIWKRAVEFFPKLKELPLSEFSKGRKVRVGLRPYMPDGKPMIGPVPGLTNVFLATGHEGGGLAMGLGTAEMVADLVLGNPVRVNNTPFAVQGRCGS